MFKYVGVQDRALKLCHGCVYVLFWLHHKVEVTVFTFLDQEDNGFVIFWEWGVFVEDSAVVVTHLYYILLWKVCYQIMVE